jgi:hypothetical protein
LNVPVVDEARVLLVSAHIAASVRTRIETSLLPPLTTVWAFYLVSVAEDARFELARACTQHAFQVCGRAFAVGQHGL